MKKSLVFILALTLVLGSFGFSFAGVDVGEVVSGSEDGLPTELDISCCPPSYVTPGGIKIIKSITPSGVSSDSTFSFNVYQGTEIINETIITLSGAGETTYEGLTPGAYTVKEVDIPLGYTLLGNNPKEIEVCAGETITVNFENYAPPVVTTPPVVTVELVIPFIKEVTGGRYLAETFNFVAELWTSEASILVASDDVSLAFSNNLMSSQGAFNFELTSTQAAAWLPGLIKIAETPGTSSNWTYTDNPYWVEVNGDGSLGDIYFTEIGGDPIQAVTFRNQYEGDPIDLQIPICKEATANGSFGTQRFRFDISVQDESTEPGNDLPQRIQMQRTILEGPMEASSDPSGPWVTLPELSITLQDSITSGCISLNFTDDQLTAYDQNEDGYLLLKIFEKNEGASGWEYDDEVYYIEFVRCMVVPASIEKQVVEYGSDNMLVGDLSFSNELIAAVSDPPCFPGEWSYSIMNDVEEFVKLILFENSYNYTSSGGGSTSSGGGRTAIIEDEPEIILVEEEPIPLAVEELIIPAAIMPRTGGFGFGVFMLVGGAMTAYGVRLRKEDEK